MTVYSRLRVRIPGLALVILAIIVLGAQPTHADGPRDTTPGEGDGISTATANFSIRICKLAKYAANPVLSVGTSGSWDDNGVRAPATLKEGATYKMWYTGSDGSNPFQVGLATSANGTTWIKDTANNPVLSPSQTWEAAGIIAGDVISDSGVYKMWYTGLDNSGVFRVGYATSPDGVAWTKHTGNPVLDVGTAGSWEDEDVVRPTIIKEGSTYHMWYRGYDGVTSRIGHATSPDGLTWTRDAANPVLDVGLPGAWDWLHVYAPSVVTYNGVYLLWYSGETLPPSWQTGYALSADGSNWTRGGLLIPEGDPGTFDMHSADYASAILDGTTFRIWYSGVNDAYTDNIGYATAQICDVNTTVYLPLLLKASGPGNCPAYYTDDFSDPSSGWRVDEDGDQKYAYTGGQYQILVKNPSKDGEDTPGAKATDFALAVSARRTSGNEGAYSILFGIGEDWSGLYEFDVYADSYSIWKHDEGGSPAWTILKNWTYSSYINTGTSWNRLKVVRQGNNIAVYVNDHYLTSVTDGSYTGLRRVGLAAYSPGGSSLDARFDNFSLYPASCGPSAASAGFEMGTPEIHQAPLPPGLDRAP
jgi:predicted GH43/DUF377 family glycosyl hydrolase